MGGKPAWRHTRTRYWYLDAGTTSSTTRWNVGIKDSVNYVGGEELL
jgi:hypothetical protein